MFQRFRGDDGELNFDRRTSWYYLWIQLSETPNWCFYMINRKFYCSGRLPKFLSRLS